MVERMIAMMIELIIPKLFRHASTEGVEEDTALLCAGSIGSRMKSASAQSRKDGDPVRWRDERRCTATSRWKERAWLPMSDCAIAFCLILSLQTTSSGGFRFDDAMVLAVSVDGTRTASA
mmetsp:Transcript_25655/g.60122  ORF Transcript_25655/g.60122 Transcript_25655/m.60122 type:complete len:120 (-) Transcript_25655:882-1241(-)